MDRFALLVNGDCKMKLKYAYYTKENVMNEFQNITQDNKRLKEVNDKLLIKNEESSKTQNELLNDNADIDNTITC